VASAGEDEVFAEFLSDVADVDIEEVGEGLVVLGEEVFVKARPGDDLAAVEGEVFDQRILAGGEIEGTPVEQDFAAGGVEDHAGGEIDAGRGGALGAADQGAEAGVGFVEVEGLDEVVVGAEVEAAHTIIEGTAGGEEKDGGAFFQAETAEDFPAVELGQHDIENDGVVVGLEGAVEAFLAVGGGIDGVALLAERLGDGGTEVGFIFDEKEFHGEEWRGGADVGRLSLRGKMVGK
jgi:hypothetical protein